MLMDPREASGAPMGLRWPKKHLPTISPIHPLPAPHSNRPPPKGPLAASTAQHDWALFLLVWTLPPPRPHETWGIGFHTAGLDAADRTLVEALFQRGALPVLCSTSGLAQVLWLAQRAQPERRAHTASSALRSPPEQAQRSAA